MRRFRYPAHHFMNEKSGQTPDLSAAIGKYQNYLRMLAEVQLGQWLQARVGASDIVQETLLDATRDIGQFRGTTEAEMVAWLKTILLNNVNRTVDFHVSAQKRSVRREVSLDRLKAMHQSSVAIEEALASQISTPSDSADRHEMLIAVADCMAELPADQRTVVMLRSIEGKSYEEVAAIMERSEPACRMLWLRAIKDLRKQFARRRLI